MLRATIIFLSLLLLWTLEAQFNHYLAHFQIHVFAGGLYVAFAALRLRLVAGLAAMMAGGLLCDANSPQSVWFGTHAVLFAFAFAVIQSVRDRMARDDTAVRVAVALLANLGLFLAFSFTQISRVPHPSTTWLRLFVDLLCSQVLVTVIAPWFFALQRRALELVRSEPAVAN